jgi:GNAT superfamily N-acetyltransferase
MITIRQATIEDLPKLQELNQKIMVNNPLFDDDLIENFAFTPEGEQFFRESIERINGCCLIAEENGQMLGYTDGEPKPIVYRKRRYFEIDNLGVIPEMKGKGLGKLLLEAITRWAKTHDFARLYLNCYIKNEAAIGFYKHNGFYEIDISLEKEI